MARAIITLIHILEINNPSNVDVYIDTGYVQYQDYTFNTAAE